MMDKSINMDVYDLDLYRKIRKVRKLNGLPIADLSVKINYPLVGKQLKSKKTGSIYLIEKAYKQWLWGWYVTLLLEHNKSHAVVFWENISSQSNFIKIRCKKTRNDEFELVEFPMEENPCPECLELKNIPADSYSDKTIPCPKCQHKK